MNHSWQSDHLPKLEVADLEAGDIALCGSFAARAMILSELDQDRVAFVAPLGSRPDPEWLLRGLHRPPHIRHLVVLGDAQRLAGEASLFGSVAVRLECTRFFVLVCGEGRRFGVVGTGRVWLEGEDSAKWYTG